MNNKILLHVGTVHDIIPEFVGLDKGSAELYHTKLRKVYDEIVTPWLMKVHKELPINHMYIEGSARTADTRNDLIKSLRVVDLPVKAFLEAGIDVKITGVEHEAFLRLFALTGKDLIAHAERVKNIPVERMIKEYETIFQSRNGEINEIFRDFFREDLKYNSGAGIFAAREHAIAKNISETLQEGETGVLFLGKKHGNSPYIKRYLNSDIFYRFIDLFPEIF